MWHAGSIGYEQARALLKLKCRWKILCVCQIKRLLPGSRTMKVGRNAYEHESRAL